MGDRSAIALAASAVLFILFFASVAQGAATRAPMLGNVAEALLLAASVLCFVVGVLTREAQARGNKHQKGGDTP